MTRRARWSTRVAVAARVCGLAAATTLASCGGGDLVSTFHPQRMVVFGDEESLINTDGSKYSINALPVAGTVTCTSNAIWVQTLATYYNFGMALVADNGSQTDACNANPNVTAQARIYARVGAAVADVSNQMALHAASVGSFVGTDLVTVMVGQKDIINAFEQQSPDQAVATVQAAGLALATQVNAMAQAGAKVLIATIPNQGATPYAVAKEAATPGSAGVLTALTNDFNAKLRGALINDGRMIGLVQADEQLQAIINFPAAYGYVNLTSAACTVALPACTTSTLQSDATIANYLWADDRHFSVDAHARIGAVAVTRATNNPF